MTVASNATLQTRGNTTINITGGGTLTNNGTLTTNGGTRTMTIESTSGALTVINNSGAAIASGTALTIKDTDTTSGG